MTVTDTETGNPPLGQTLHTRRATETALPERTSSDRSPPTFMDSVMADADPPSLPHAHLFGHSMSPASRGKRGCR